MSEELLKHLRRNDVKDKLGTLEESYHVPLLEEWERSGVKFAADGRLEGVYYSALTKLFSCIAPTAGDKPILQEGGVYHGCWLESTGTINAELLSRFIPSVSQATYAAFAEFQRNDGLMPYKVTGQGPAYRQIQLVSPLARSVWNHYLLNGRDKGFLGRMYDAMRKYDIWLVAHRNTLGTGCVEAFSTFDTGHDLSPRFWHVADVPHLGDATQYDPDSPILPFLAPDLTANVYCQRKYLSLIAAELGEPGNNWNELAAASLQSLFQYCYDDSDGFFYDQDRHGRHVRIQSDVLLRVLACEVGDRALFDAALERYLLNTSKFFAGYGFTSIAMDDSRFDPHSGYNTWAGTSNFLTMIRTPHAFEHHGRYVELTWFMRPIMSAMANMTRFAQTLSPWTGEEGFTESYSPAILCVLDFVERQCGIVPRPDDELWFTGLVPYAMGHNEVAERTAYRRVVDGIEFELVNSREGCIIYRDKDEHIAFPYGVRVITDRQGRLQSIIGMSVRDIAGKIQYADQYGDSCRTELELKIKGNERQNLINGRLTSVSNMGVVLPTYR